MKTFHYKNFSGSIEFDLESKVFYGKLLYMRDLVTYEAPTIKELEHEFQISIDEYLETCRALNREPARAVEHESK